MDDEDADDEDDELDDYSDDEDMSWKVSRTWISVWDIFVNSILPFSITSL